MSAEAVHRPRRPRWIAWTLGLLSIIVVLGTSFIAWVNRVQLFVIPAAWKEVLKLEPGKDRDRALARLIALQDPAYLPGQDYRMEKVRAREGRTIFFLCWDNDPNARTSVPRQNGFPTEEFDHIHLLLDDRGRVIESLLPVFNGHGVRVSESVVRSESGDHDIIRASICRGGETGPYQEIFSVDELGFVPEGLVRPGNLEIPVCGSPQKPTEPDRERITRFIRSPRKGDAHRALSLIEYSLPKSADLIRPLLSRPEPGIRARAVAVLGAAVETADDLITFLGDKEPLVRLTAAESIQGKKGWVRHTQRLTEDGNRDVALGAHRLLCQSSNLEIARASFLFLAKNQAVRWWDFELRRLATTECSEPLVIWLEQNVVRSWTEERGIQTFDSVEEQFPPEFLQPFLPRLIRLFRQMEGLSGPRDQLARLIVRIDDPRAEAFLAEVLAQAPTDDFKPQEVLEPLLKRSTPLRTSEALQALEKIAQTPDNRALMILCQWKAAGACERLLLLAKEKGVEFIDFELWEHAPDSFLDAAMALGEEFKKRVEEIRASRTENRKMLEDLEKAREEEE